MVEILARLVGRAQLNLVRRGIEILRELRSSPGLLAGRSVAIHDGWLHTVEEVEILARLVGRAQHALPRLRPPQARGVVEILARLVGRAQQLHIINDLLAALNYVEILARLVGRAQPQVLGVDPDDYQGG